MKFPLGHDFCVWLIAPNDGRVRKVRVTLQRALCLGIILVGIIGVFIFVTSDYTRVQILRAKNYLWIQKLSKERDALASTNQNLNSEVGNLKALNSKALVYEKRIKERLDELASIISSATSLEMMPKSNATAAEVDTDSDGLGGAEVDCDQYDGCGDLAFNPTQDMSLLQPSAQQSINTPAALKITDMSHNDLVETLDRYTDLVKAVPLGLPGQGHVNSGFGFRRSPFSGKIRMHEGVDLSLALGSYILSTADGVVSTVTRTSTYGLMIDVTHDSKVTTRYAHLSKTFVSQGEKICRGEILGLVGSTGRSTGPHLHYEVRIDGKALDPKSYIDLAAKLKRLL